MNRYLSTLRSSPFTQGIGGLFIALVCAVALIGCEGDTTNPTYNTYTTAPTSTLGSLNVNVYPAAADVVVTGPAGFTPQTFTGNQFIADLEPGTYTATATAPGFLDVANTINVVANQTSSISLALKATPIITEAPRAVYRDGSGNLVPIDTSNMQSGQFIFYAWLQDQASGIVTTALPTALLGGDPGMPLLTEQRETAPSFTQNLAGAWVGFKDAQGVVRSVIGADVRWEIDQWYSLAFNSMQFGTSDDNRIALNYGVFDDQADTRTNNARLAAERFPLIASQYPLYNQTGIGTPFADGFTWVTLFSPDATASGRIVAVATINGEEIGKQILYKNFAPAPKIEITKTVDQAIVNLGTAGTGTVTWTVTVKNTGTGDATSIDLNDFLASGGSGSYTLGPLPAGCTATADPDIFNCTIGPLAAPGGIAPPENTQLLGNAWNFAVLANATVTNTSTAANPTVVSGNVGVSAGSAVTGFPTGIVLNGTVHNNDAVAVAAQTAVTAAYTALGEISTPSCNATNLALTGTFGPGVYCYSSSVTMGQSLTLDAGGDPTAEFIFRIGSTLDTPAGATITLVNGASPCNVYWKVGSSATIGANNFFVGNIISQASITVGAGTSISGRALARTGQVSLSTNAINAPLACVEAPASELPFTFTANVTAPGTYCNEVQVTSYTDGTTTTTPVDLNDQACFTAVSPILSIVKDFVADDNSTSLGSDKTVAVNVPAKLRVRVINSGTGAATGVSVHDAFTAALSTGLLADYRVISATSTTNALGGFDTGTYNLASGATATPVFLTIAASVDNRDYCDTATVSDSVGPVGSDVACLHTRTPNLTITKTDAPASVLPGATYTSTIGVRNAGSADAKNVVVSDLLGLNSAANIRAIYVSSNLNGSAGTLANNVVTANSVVTLVSGGTMTFTVVSRIPLGAAAGSYCDTATVTSSNAVTKEASACVVVPAFSALQTQLSDMNDPVVVGDNVTYFSVLYVEPLSNEGVNNNVLTYLYGHTVATDLVTPGAFDITSTKVYLDRNPVRDPITGFVVSDTSSPTAVLQVAGTNYTIVTDVTNGKQVITMSPGIELQPNTAIYVVNVAQVPTGTASGMYTTSYIWDSKGMGTIPQNVYQASSSEPTTVLP